VDDTFTLDKEWVLRFCDELAARRINIAWGCQAHVKTVDEAMLTRMKEVGLVQVDIGVESGSDKVLNALRKQSDAESIKRAFKTVKKVGIRTMASFIFGAPTETYEDVEATMRLAREIKPSFASSYFLTPYPGTELMKMAEENNWLVDNDHAHGGLRKGPMLKINFTEDELYRIRSRFQRMFIYRNFFSLLLSPRYAFRALSIFFRYPLGFFVGIKRFLTTHALDDFFFEFFNYYIRKRSCRKKPRGTDYCPESETR